MQPLKDIKVLDFTTLLPGPLATLYLADWGAEVLRIEAPDREDISRTMPPFADGTSTTHAFLNRSKKSVSIDLKDSKSQKIIKDLVLEYDVVIEQFRPGVMAKLGLDYATLSAVNPRLVYCSLTGYGQSGPYKDRAGHDINYASLSGLAAMTGKASDGPILHGNPICDMTGSFHAVMGILMALYHRERTGQGQAIDVSITDSSLMLSSLWAQMSLVAKQTPSWETTLLNGSSFYGYYRTKDRRYLSVGGLEPKFLKGFLEAIGGLELLGMDLNSAEGGAKLKEEIQSRIEQRTFAEWMSLFQGLDVCVEPVLRLDEVIKHPHFAARSMIVAVDAQNGKAKQQQLASPLRFSQFQPVYRYIGVTKGAHNHLYV